MDDLNFLQTNYSGTGPEIIAPCIYIVEDDRSLAQTLTRYLSKVLPLKVQSFPGSFEFLNFIQHMDKSHPFCLVTDISLENGADGLLMADYLKDHQYKFVCIAMTGFATIESAINATKKGIYHYLTKPFELKSLHALIERSLKDTFNFHCQSSRPATLHKTDSTSVMKRRIIEVPGQDDIFYGMIGRSAVMKNVFEKISKIGHSDSTVLITGPSGTGKELVALALHKISAREMAPKVSVNCGAIPADLLESELFGHMKGAFTGAIANRKGRFELADKGTIFLDEIGDMSLVLQVKLLRVLQSRQIEIVGGNAPKDVDVRVIAATHRNLEDMVAKNTFREDLFYRLNVIPIKMPALKDRREDIPLLIGFFLDKFVSADRSNALSFREDALDLLMGHDWPGNVRELENVIERLVILKGGSEVTPEDLPVSIFTCAPKSLASYKSLFSLPEDGIDLRQLVSDIEDTLILQALEKCGGNKHQASKLLNLNRTTLIEKMKKKSLPL